jgi:hypothetical protein
MENFFSLGIGTCHPPFQMPGYCHQKELKAQGTQHFKTITTKKCFARK